MNEANPNGKRTYEKPEITAIEFSADEVMAVGCKLASGGPTTKKPGVGCIVSGCFQDGS